MAPSELPPESAPVPASDKLVLIVDDEKDVCELLKINAAKEGFRTIAATSGRDAINRMGYETPDLIVLDLMMPGQSGYEVMRSLQASGHGSIPIFVITARVLDDSTVAMIRSEGNVVEFFSKPFQMALFVASLHRHLKTVGSSPRQSRHAGDGSGDDWGDAK